jgi:hypothetical protein
MASSAHDELVDAIHSAVHHSPLSPNQSNLFWGDMSPSRYANMAIHNELCDSFSIARDPTQQFLNPDMQRQVHEHGDRLEVYSLTTNTLNPRESPRYCNLGYKRNRSDTFEDDDYDFDYDDDDVPILERDSVRMKTGPFAQDRLCSVPVSMTHPNMPPPLGLFANVSEQDWRTPFVFKPPSTK